MKEVVIEEYGSNDVVQVQEVERPSPAAGQLLVKVHASGVNPVDWKIREGAGQRFGMTLPIRLGMEIAGTVETLGAGVSGFAVGDPVFGMIRNGGYAEYALATPENLAPKPKKVNFVEAAAIPLGALTAWQAMFDAAGVEAGQKLLITSASGGVGSLGVQLAKNRGAHVTGMASGRNEAFVRELGADVFVDYTRQPFEEAVHDMDVVFDTVGGDTYERSFRTVKKSGFVVTVAAFPKDEGERYGIRTARVQCQSNPEELRAIAEQVDAGKLKGHVATVLPLADVKKALELSAAGRTRGKIVLEVAPAAS